MNPFVKFIQELTYWGMERVGKYYSSYRGFVYRRDDPKGLGRVQLFVPHVYGPQPYEVWAFPVGVYSGPGFGMQCIPLVGQMVMVEFEGGDPKIPLWKHGHFGLLADGISEIPAHLRDPDIYWFRTPKGLGFEINDKTGTIKVIGSNVQYNSVEHSISAGTNKIEVTDTGINITLGDGNKCYIDGKYPVLYSKQPSASQILNFDEIGVSEKIRIG